MKSKRIWISLLTVIAIAILTVGTFKAIKVANTLWDIIEIFKLPEDEKFRIIKKVQTDYGDSISVNTHEDSFDSDMFFNVSCNGKHLYTMAIGDPPSIYDYDLDFISESDKLLNQFCDGNTRAYQFRWGIVYTIDNGNNWYCVMKHNYDEVSFVDIFDTLMTDGQSIF